METSSSEVSPFFVLKLVKLAVMIFMLFLSLPLCSGNHLGCELHNGDNDSPMSYSRDGDVIIGGILQILLTHDQETFDFSERPSIAYCGGTSYEYLKHFLAFIFAIEEINNSTDLLPNITLGFQIYDTCTSENLAVKSVLNIISETQEPIPNYICERSPKSAAVVGHLLSSSTYTLARLTQLFGYPQVSYGAYNSFFNNRENFPLLYWTVPSVFSQFHAIIQVLVHFGWTWVGIITTDDDSNLLSGMGLKKEMVEHGICVDFLTVISIDPQAYPNSELRVTEVIKNSSVNVIILFCLEIFLIGFLGTGSIGVTGKVWITPVGMESFFDNEHSKFINTFNGSLIITIKKGEIPGFQEFLFRATYNNMPDNTFLICFWKFHLGYLDISGKLSNEECCSNNTLWKNLVSEDAENIHRFSYTIYNAVYLIAEALNHMKLQKCLNKPSAANPMQSLKRKLNYYLKQMDLKASSGTDIASNNEGFVKGSFDILNFFADSNSKITKPIIGSWSPPSSNQVQINNSAIAWNPWFNETPQSFCSYPCFPGYRKSLKSGKLACCFDCMPCNDGEITNGTAMETCASCPDDEWSNPTRDKCIKRPLHFLSYEEDLGISLAIIATIFFGMTSSVLWIFVKYRNTPLVRANNCNLSYVLLVSLMICFLLSFLFIGHPEELTCLMRQTTFGFVFAVAISAILGKTTTVLIAFNATKPGSKLRKCVGSRISTGLVILCSLGEFIICVTWLISASPFVELDTKTIPGTMIVQCNEGSIIAFYVAVSYIGVLAIFSFIIAFISRKLPDTFNEAQYITFSMLVFCSVWISFIPTYICTKGKYMVAVEIFAILASSGALMGFIFFPKCFIIFLRPERNSKTDIKVKVFQVYG
ncbi:vomeronasal type-2 receptor 26-like [Leptodactylus fuscus]|uniref:vomeronasal type-2 receptor 26-like n=1 Tax=Leptodactylus fuscus TaxID=238119 RepID=UPI003F4F220A